MEQVIVAGLAVSLAPGSNFDISHLRARMTVQKEAYMEEGYPTVCLVSTSCKEGIEHRG